MGRRAHRRPTGDRAMPCSSSNVGSQSMRAGGLPCRSRPVKLEILIVRGRSDARLRTEVLALRHQLRLQRQVGRPRWQPSDRILLAAASSRAAPGPAYHGLHRQPATAPLYTKSGPPLSSFPEYTPSGTAASPSSLAPEQCGEGQRSGGPPWNREVVARIRVSRSASAPSADQGASQYPISVGPATATALPSVVEEPMDPACSQAGQAMPCTRAPMGGVAQT